MKPKKQPEIIVHLQVCEILFLEDKAKEYIIDNFFMNPDEDTLYVAVIQEDKPNGDLIRQKAILTNNQYQYEVDTEFLSYWVEYKVVPTTTINQDVILNLFE